MIIFAGQHVMNFPLESDVWYGVYTPSSTELHWIPAQPTGPQPAARFGHTAVLDTTNNLMITFGGGKGTSTPAPCLNDVWLLNNANGLVKTATWTQEAPSGSLPSARFASTAVYDPTANTMTVFGGYDCTSHYLNDVWVLSNANGTGGTPTWTQLSTAGAPRQGARARPPSTIPPTA
jgi:hypothetical protein